MTSGADSSNPVEVIVRASSPDLIYDGKWTSSPPLADLWNSSAFSSYPFSDRLYTLQPGESIGSVLYNVTGVTIVRMTGTLNLTTVADRVFLGCDIIPSLRGWLAGNPVVGPIYANGYVFCLFEHMSPTISYTLNFTLQANREQAAWFDRITMIPAPETKLDTALVRLDHRNPLIQYDTSWQNLRTSHMTNTSGATMRLDFEGTSVTGYSTQQNSTGMRGAGAQAVLTVDDQCTQNITLDDLVSKGPFFITPDLPPGPHRLEITYHTNSSTNQPLSISALAVQNAVAPAGGLSSSPLNCTLKTIPSAIHSIPSTTVTPPTINPSSGIPTFYGHTEPAKGAEKMTKVAVGVGVAAAAVIAVSVLLLYRRRHRRRLHNDARNESPADHAISPYAQAPIIPTPLYKDSTVTTTSPSHVPLGRSIAENPPPYTTGAHAD